MKAYVVILFIYLFFFFTFSLVLQWLVSIKTILNYISYKENVFCCLY